MPELPEVETIVQDLKKSLLNQRIKEVDVRLFKIVKDSVPLFKKTLKNNCFVDIFRQGKFIVIKLAQPSSSYLLIHLRLTGQLIYKQDQKIIAGGHGELENDFGLPSSQTHLIIYFQDNSQLFYNDQRQFGYWQIIKVSSLEKIKERLGLEPLDSEFTINNFQKLLQGRKGKIKPFLLNQEYIAGLGNIYVDESLFQAKIKPTRSINTLVPAEIKKLHQAIFKILQKAINYRGTTFNHYRDSQGRQGNFSKFLKVYQREGEKCLRCGQALIKKIKVSGRGTRYCPYCQK
ncbi:bifunctional DNA-formamidopyrimidine glycosylase/DNA-(apurinic or apyrimidinic site) lyase [Patescibacteria group bacterium]|nr:bifunctional DNA-formamidopyrimidine glycosylase/DNA-(apurinic or apyrimidinic site) lyase [Patescibacteria group bacterium]